MNDTIKVGAAPQQRHKPGTIFETLSRVSENIVPRLCGYCGGAVASIVSVCTQLYVSGFNLEFEILFEPVWQVVADLWQGKV